MIEGLAALMKELEEWKQECLNESDKLILEDAPKNRFSILSGKRQAFQMVQDFIMNLERPRENS